MLKKELGASGRKTKCHISRGIKISNIQQSKTELGIYENITMLKAPPHLHKSLRQSQWC